MAGDLGPWSGAALLRRLAANLVATEPLADLYAHSLWALFDVADCLRPMRNWQKSLAIRVEALLAEGDPSSVQSRRELEQVHYGRAAGKVLIKSRHMREVAPMPEPELEGLTNFLYEMGLLKRYKRAGWMIAGIDNPESIAEHSFRTAIIGYLLAVMEGADPAKTAALYLFHDSQETRIGDVPSVGKAYVVTAPNPEVTADQVADTSRCSRAVRDLVEVPTRRSLEPGTKDADKLECLIKLASTRLRVTRTCRLDRNLDAALRSFGPSARRGLSAGTTATVVEGLRGVVSTADQGCGPAVYRETARALSVDQAHRSQRKHTGPDPRSFQVLVTTFSSTSRPALRAALRPSLGRPTSPSV